MKDLAEEECATLVEQMETMQEELRHLLLKEHRHFARLAREYVVSANNSGAASQSGSNSASASPSYESAQSQPEAVIMEVRPGVGGQESQLFTAEVVRMYRKFAENVGWDVEELSITSTDTSTSNPGSEGLKEAIIQISSESGKADGDAGNVYDRLKWEAGVHRVQRIPQTQSLGKLQTSTIAVIVLPVADNGEDNTDKKDDVVDPKDVKTEVMRSRGAGGQHVNKTESAIRLTHEPTGITVSMQDSRSQHQNRTKAWAILRARLLDVKLRDEASANRAIRKDQVSGMERSDRVRTYNFPQDRVTDHRLGLSLNDINSIMDGDFDQDWTEGLARIMEGLKQQDEENKIEELQSLWKEAARVNA